MARVREAKRSDISVLEGKRNVLGGPSFSAPALEMFVLASDFSVLVAGGSGIVAYHEGKGGKSRILLLVGNANDVLGGVEESARKAGTIKITMEVSPDSPALPDLMSAGYRKAGEVANYFGKGVPALFLEKNL